MTRPVLFGSQRTDRRAADLEYRQLSEQPPSPAMTRPSQDPTSSLGRSRFSLAHGPQILFGRIVDAVAYARMYKVQVDRGVGTLRCSDSAHTGLGVTGAKQLNTYPVGTGVVVLYHQQMGYGVILCAVPDWAFDPRHSIADMIQAGSRVGLQVDVAHNSALLTAKRGGLIDFSAGRPADSIPAGEWGAMAETGVGMFADPFMAFLRADEATGVWAFYFDQMLRVAGHNLQIRSAGFDREDLDDESEFSSVEGVTPYPWEALGTYSPLLSPAQILDPETVQKTDQTQSKYEPLYPDQLGFFRSTNFKGYLGQGGKRVVAVPATIAYGLPGDAHRYSQDEKHVGLFEETLALDGTAGWRSAAGIYLGKVPPRIVVPKRKVRPEDPSGDTAQSPDGNYASCGRFGPGPEHRVQGGVQGSGWDRNMLDPATLFDQMAYLFNWQGLHPFVYHERDWYTPDESEFADVPFFQAPPFASLKKAGHLPAAPKVDLKVDDRYGLAEYYLNFAYIAINRTGGLSIVGGCGEEIRMAGGRVEIYSPADTIIAPGRSFIAKAGWDVALAAHNCLDATATHGDARLEANREVKVLGGASGCGGVLIESKAVEPSFELGGVPGDEDVPPRNREDTVGGVILRAKTSMVTTLAQQILLDTGVFGTPEDPDPETNPVTSRIILDAGVHGTIIEQASQVRRHIREAAIDILQPPPPPPPEPTEDGETLPPPPPPPPRVIEYWYGGTRFGTQVVFLEDAYLWGCAAVKEKLIVAGDLYAQATQAYTQSALIAEIDAAIASRDLADTLELADAELGYISETFPDLWELEFYFRDPKDYLTDDDYGIVEPIWHQMARGDEQTLPTWEEQSLTHPVRGPGAPWPGYTVLTGDSYGLQDASLFNHKTGVPEDRGSVYETEANPPPVEWRALDTWPVVRHPVDDLNV